MPEAGKGRKIPDTKGKNGQAPITQEFFNEVEPKVDFDVAPQELNIERHGAKTYEAFADQYASPAP